MTRMSRHAYGAYTLADDVIYDLPEHGTART